MMNRRSFGQTLGAAAISAAAPIFQTSAEAAPTRPEALTPPDFLHEIDRQLYNELAVIERSLARVKANLLEANTAHPAVRNAILCNMRCSFQTFSQSHGWAREIVRQQHDANRRPLPAA